MLAKFETLTPDIAPRRFTDLITVPELLMGVEDRRFEQTTPVQSAVFDTVAAGHDLVACAEKECGPSKAASLQFLYLLANSIARLCYGDYQLRRRIDELSALYKLSTVLAVHRNLQHVLDTAVQQVAEVMKVKAVSIRLLDDAGRSLVPRATFGLTPQYLHKGPIVADRSVIFAKSLAGEVVVDLVRRAAHAGSPQPSTMRRATALARSSFLRIVLRSRPRTSAISTWESPSS